MSQHPHRSVLYSITALALIVSVLTAGSRPTLAKETKYAIELVVVTNGKKSIETDADLTFGDTVFTVVPDKASLSSAKREIPYSAIVAVDQSYSKKPMLSAGGAVVTALLISVFVALPFLFIKKRKHWMTVRTEKEFAVMKLGDRNYRQIAAEFQTRGVKVSELHEEGKKDK